MPHIEISHANTPTYKKSKLATLVKKRRASIEMKLPEEFEKYKHDAIGP